MKIHQMYRVFLKWSLVTLFSIPITPFPVTLAGSIAPQYSGQMYSASDYSCIRAVQERVLIDWGQWGRAMKNLNVLQFCIT